MYPASFTAQQPQNDLVDDEILIYAPASFSLVLHHSLPSNHKMT